MLVMFWLALSPALIPSPPFVRWNVCSQIEFTVNSMADSGIGTPLSCPIGHISHWECFCAPLGLNTAAYSTCAAGSGKLLMTVCCLIAVSGEVNVVSSGVYFFNFVTGSEVTSVFIYTVYVHICVYGCKNYTVTCAVQEDTLRATSIELQYSCLTCLYTCRSGM